jgi:14-3-3 protein epsilon
MANERDVALFMAQVLDQTDRYQDMMNFMKRVVELNPALSVDERNLLAVSYKNVLTPRRNGLQTLSAIASHMEGQATPNRIREICDIRAGLEAEVQAICNQLIELVTSKLLPAATTPNARIFFEKLRADYYRYMCESISGEEQREIAAKAREAYGSAIDQAKAVLKPASSLYLGLVLNYTVFLDEALHSRAEALEIANETYAEGSIAIQDANDEEKAEVSMLLDLLRSNINTWTEKTQ